MILTKTRSPAIMCLAVSKKDNKNAAITTPNNIWSSMLVTHVQSFMIKLSYNNKLILFKCIKIFMTTVTTYISILLFISGFLNRQKSTFNV